MKSEKDKFPMDDSGLLLHKLEFSERKMKLENETIKDGYVETFIKLENEISTKLDTAIKTEAIKQENDSTTDNALDTYPPDSYHFLLKKENGLCRDVTEVKEEKIFCFRDSMRVKTEDGVNLSCQNINLSPGQNNQHEKLNKSFKQQSDCTEHERIHSASRPFSCSVCNKSFTWKSNCIKHERIHTGLRPFSCSICNKSFTDKASCAKHELIHSGSRPFSCHVCNMSFTRKDSLKRHEKIHNG